MSRFDDVQNLCGRGKSGRGHGQPARSCSKMTVRTLGFDYFALLHHVDLSRSAADYVRLDRLSAGLERKERAVRTTTPTIRFLPVSQKSVTPFLWTDVPRLISLSPRQEEILSGAQLAGIGNGVTVPINIPGEFSGSCSFSMRYGRDIPLPALPTAQYLGCFAFQAARRVVRDGGQRSKPAT